MSGTAKKPLDTYELVPGVAAGSNTGVVHIGADSGIVKYMVRNFQTMHSKGTEKFFFGAHIHCYQSQLKV